VTLVVRMQSCSPRRWRPSIWTRLPGPMSISSRQSTLATDNLVSLLGLHRQWRGALVGHLAAFEMTSVIPMARYEKAVRRHLPAQAAEFYKVHVVADAVHARLAADELLTGLVETDPDSAQNVLFGVRSLVAVEERFTDHLLTAWKDGRSSLRTVDARRTGLSLPSNPAVDIEVQHARSKAGSEAGATIGPTGRSATCARRSPDTGP
jgi:hypothetical protein